MKINFDIDINDKEIPLSHTDKKSKSVFLYATLSVLSHFCFAGLLFSSALFANNIVVDEGNDSIKAVMVDLTQLAAPEQSLVENTTETQNKENNEVVETPPVEEPTIEPVTEPEVVKEEVKPEPIPVKEAVIKQEQKVKPKKKQPPAQKSEYQRVRQEIVSDNNIAKTAVAPSISDNRQFSATPSPISRNQPEYPRRALDMRLEGYVIAIFDVNSDGRVENIRIVEANPNNIFNRSVITAMKTWKYKPIAANNLKIKIIFNRDKSINLDGV
ncbi:hypothetical protein A9G13_08945 [Gilliamella sp. wkB178]|uniref:TonB family protein n=1 Tax=Gilliamella sp. wkB178 TaxID=3120259 RepID=UPI00080E3C76|nr:TonB family protein [Gilliamella apicola]OCG07098.1 hypothetical protein A9G13_08945 [Gilliamella apicola]